MWKTVKTNSRVGTHRLVPQLPSHFHDEKCGHRAASLMESYITEVTLPIYIWGGPFRSQLLGAFSPSCRTFTMVVYFSPCIFHDVDAHLSMPAIKAGFLFPFRLSPRRHFKRLARNKRLRRTIGTRRHIREIQRDSRVDPPTWNSGFFESSKMASITFSICF